MSSPEVLRSRQLGLAERVATCLVNVDASITTLDRSVARTLLRQEFGILGATYISPDVARTAALKRLIG